jgi:hypothetical protein
MLSKPCQPFFRASSDIARRPFLLHRRRIVGSVQPQRETRGWVASLPLLLGIPAGTLLGLGIGAAAGDPGLGAAIGCPAGLMIGLIWTILWEQLRRREKA